MPRKFRIAYFAHTIRSDWNNGNAHFLRGLLKALGSIGHTVQVYEPECEWSIRNLREEPAGEQSLAQFSQLYLDLNVTPYPHELLEDSSYWDTALKETDVVILHEWNPPLLAELLLRLRDRNRFRLLFHDTHHRASSSPEQIELLRVQEFDGVLAFGDALRRVYQGRFHLRNVWTLHEAADIEVFRPIAGTAREVDAVWIGNWGDGERASEIEQFLLNPASNLPQYKFRVYGVRYPKEGLAALESAGVEYRGYLPNLCAPHVYAAARLTFHIPRQQYSQVMDGIPTIRVFEALACGIPLISAPWQDTEGLFREGDFAWAHDCTEMTRTAQQLLSNPSLAHEQAERGRQTVLDRHTCTHRAHQLTAIFEELVQ